MPLLVLLLVATGHAIPALLNAHELHSDAAVVGLQARHLLHGEWSGFLWGSGYQTSTDSVIAAAAFAVLGATPLALTLSSFLCHLLLVAFAFATVRRRFAPWPSALLLSPLAFATGPLHTYMFSPPRQAALTLAFASIWILDGALHSRRAAISLALGSFVAGLACFADPYALIFLPALGVFLLFGSAEPTLSGRARELACGAVGGLAGLVPLWLLRHSAQAASGVLGLRSDVVAHNLTLLRQVCLPYLLGTTAYFSAQAPLVQVWPAPPWFHAIQLAGASSLLLGVLVGGACVLVRRLPFPVRRLAAAGAIMLPVTLGAFALSVMVMDRFSARYLVAIVLMAPFALAPALLLLGPPRFALLLAPYLLSTMVAGWLGYGEDVDGIRVVRHDPSASDEVRLKDELDKQGLSFALADYWVAYRLTFLYEERVLVVPWHEQLDRYPPYRTAVAAQNRVAYIYDPWRSQEDISNREAEIRAGHTEFNPAVTPLRVGRYTVLILERPPKPPPHLAQMVSVSLPAPGASPPAHTSSRAN
jgi:hypothetical protein